MHMSLSELAKMVGISSSALSQIENAKAFPSIFHLKKIADCLNSTVGEIIGEYDNISRKPMVKKNEKKIVKENASGAKLFLLSHPDPLKKMETHSIEFTKNSDSTDIMNSYPGQVFIYVVSGAINIILDEKSYDLQAGDSFYYKSEVPHKVKNINDGKTEIIWVNSPF